MIRNIIDCRNRPYRWTRINAIIEATEHDDTCVDADEAPEAKPLFRIDCQERECLSIEEAILWAHQARYHVTLYLYDVGRGTTVEQRCITLTGTNSAVEDHPFNTFGEWESSIDEEVYRDL